MVNLFKRMRKLRTLLDVRLGAGAAIFPSAASATKETPAITRLHLTYARKIYGGHQGARHFWRNCLPRLKYHNPAIPMTVKQTDSQDGPAALTIYFAEQTSKAAELTGSKSIEDKHAPVAEGTEKSVVVDLKNLEWKDIWSKVKNMTGAEDVAPTAEEEAELKKLAQLREISDQDRIRVAGHRQKKKDQERMLQEAKGEVEKLRAGL